MYVFIEETFIYEDGKCINGFVSGKNNEFIVGLFIDIDFKVL